MAQDIRIYIKSAKRKFYQYSTSFNDFDDITQKDIWEMKKETDEWYRKVFSSVYAPEEKKKMLYQYTAILNFITSSKKDRNLMSFDEKLLFLLLALDPELEIYKCYISYPLVSTKEINEAPKDKAKELKEKREKQLNIIKKAIMEKFGFFDEHLLFYEAKFFNKFVKVKNLVLKTEKKLFSELENIFNDINDFDDISEEENESIILKAEEYLEQYGVPDYQLLSCQLLTQLQNFELKSMKQLAIFFILIMDKNLDFFKIYKEENDDSQIETRAIDEIGFYSEKLIFLEQCYQRKFYSEEKNKEIKKEILKENNI